MGPSRSSCLVQTVTPPPGADVGCSRPAAFAVGDAGLRGFCGGGKSAGLTQHQQFPPYGFSSEKTLVLISHFANPSRKMLLWTSHLNTWTDGVARHGACSR